MVAFHEIVDLQRRAKACGIEDDPTLIKLLHIFQFSEMVRDSHESLMCEIQDCENALKAVIERRIMDASSNMDKKNSNGDI